MSVPKYDDKILVNDISQHSCPFFVYIHLFPEISPDRQLNGTENMSLDSRTWMAAQPIVSLQGFEHALKTECLQYGPSSLRAAAHVTDYLPVFIS